jgi:high-affinity iron transporter
MKGGDFGDPNMAFEAAAMVIGLREGLEAFVVLGIVVGILRRFGHPGKARIAILGAVGGLLASALVALVFDELFDKYLGDALFEAVVGVVALAILVYMIVWMQRHTRDLTGKMQARVRQAMADGKWALIASLGFVVAFREGVETVAFFSARRAEGATWGALGLAGMLGLGLAALAAFAIFRLSVNVNMRRFFAVTGLLLILVSAGLLVSTVHEFEEVGEEAGVEPTPLLWDLRATFPHEDQCLGAEVNDTCEGREVTANPVAAALRVFLGYSDHPTVLQGLAWVAWIGGFGGWYAASLRRRKAAPPPPMS